MFKVKNNINNWKYLTQFKIYNFDKLNHYTKIIKYFICSIKLNNLEKHIKLYKNYLSYENSLIAKIYLIILYVFL